MIPLHIFKNIESGQEVFFSSQEDLFQISPIYEKGVFTSYEFIIRINQRCNNNCNYCFNDKTNFSLSKKKMFEIISFLSRIKSKKKIILVISGGEPTIHPNFINFINSLADFSFVSIMIQTNGLMFSNEYFLNKFPKYNDLHFFVSFPSSMDEIYNYITKTNNAKLAKKGIQNMLNLAPVTLNMVITKDNYQSLVQTVDYVKEIRKSALNNSKQKELSLMISNLGCLDKNDISDLIVNYSNVTNQFKKISKDVDDNVVFIIYSGGCGFPLCILHDSVPIKLNQKKPSVDEKIISYSDLNKDFFKHISCKSCKYNSSCQGFRSAYIKKYGISQITPL